MASSLEFVEFICGQAAGAGLVHYKKMFGEYMVYINAKPVFLICDDTLFVKITPETQALMGEDAQTGAPYGGAKPHFIVADCDDGEFMLRLASELERITPLPKPKKKKV